MEGTWGLVNAERRALPWRALSGWRLTGENGHPQRNGQGLRPDFASFPVFFVSSLSQGRPSRNCRVNQTHFHLPSFFFPCLLSMPSSHHHDLMGLVAPLFDRLLRHLPGHRVQPPYSLYLTKLSHQGQFSGCVTWADVQGSAFRMHRGPIFSFNALLSPSWNP